MLNLLEVNKFVNCNGTPGLFSSETQNPPIIYGTKWPPDLHLFCDCNQSQWKISASVALSRKCNI